MSLKEIWGKLTGKNQSAEVAAQKETDITPFASEAFPVVKLTRDQLSAYRPIPLSGLVALGTAFSRLPEGARTVVQSVTKKADVDNLYVAVNPKNVIGFLQENQYGINGNIMQKNSQGKNVIAGRLSFQAVDHVPVTEITTTTLPLDPTLMVIAVALMTIEKKFDGIQKSVEEVLQFLKQEKQSKQRGNLNMLAEIMEDYKLNCQNETFCMSRVTEVLSIKTASYQDIDFYQNQIAAELQKKKGVHGEKDAQRVLDLVTYQFAEYQLACHLFAFSSFMDVLLQRNFDKESIDRASEKMIAMVKRYETLYADCHAQIAKYQQSAIEAKLRGGIGVAVKGLGTAIGNIPVVKKGSLDETLISAGESISVYNRDAIQQKLKVFEKLEVNRMDSFVENLQTVNMLYHTENAMVTDGEQLYILQQA